MIVDAEGRIISSSQTEQMGSCVDDEEVLHLLSGDLPDEIYTGRIHGKDCMVFQTALSISGWRCLCLSPRSSCIGRQHLLSITFWPLAVGQTLLILFYGVLRT